MKTTTNSILFRLRDYKTKEFLKEHIASWFDEVLLKKLLKP